MARTPDLKLFRLIRGMSQPERRYFKVSIKGQFENNKYYLLLFEAIEKQKVYDEEAIKKKIYGDRKLQSNTLTELKRYLYNNILESLIKYDQKTSIDFELKQALLKVRVLYQRGLCEDCLFILKQAMKIAIEYEKFTTCLEILDWQKRIAFVEEDIDNIEENLGHFDQEEEKYLNALNLEHQISNLHNKSFVMIKKYANRLNEEQKEELEEIKNHPILKFPEIKNHYRTNVYYHRIMSDYARMNNHHDIFYDINKKLYGFILKHQQFSIEYPMNLLHAYNRYTLGSYFQEKHAETEELLVKFYTYLGFKSFANHERYKGLSYYYVLALSFYSGTNQLSKGIQKIQDLEKEDPRVKETLKINLLICKVFLYFRNGDYSLCQEPLYEIINLTKDSKRIDIKAFARVVNLLVNYELGNYLLIESLISSSNRYLSNKTEKSPVETLLIKFIKRIVKLPPSHDYQVEFKKFMQDCGNIIKQHPNEEKGMINSYVNYWGSLYIKKKVKK